MLRISLAVLCALTVAIICSAAAMVSDKLIINFFNVGKGGCILAQQAEHNIND